MQSQSALAIRIHQRQSLFELSPSQNLESSVKAFAHFKAVNEIEGGRKEDRYR